MRTADACHLMTASDCRLFFLFLRFVWFRETEQQAFDAHAVDTWSLGTTLFMALLGVQPWEEVGDYKFQAIAEGKNLDVVLEGWKLRDVISDEAVDLLQVGERLAPLTRSPTYFLW